MKTLTFTFGRFQPPHWDHVSLFRECERIADRNDSECMIFPSVTHDKKKNPLSFEDKQYYLRALSPDTIFSYNPDLKTIFDIVKYYGQFETYNKYIIVVGEDRYTEFNGRLLPHLNKFVIDAMLPQCLFAVKMANHKTEVHSSTIRDLVKMDQWVAFHHLYRCKTNLNGNDILKLFYDLKEGMGK